VEVGEQAHLEALVALERRVHVPRVDADAEDIGSRRGIAGTRRRDVLELARAHRAEVERVEHQQHVAATQVREAHLLAVLVAQGELRGDVTDLDRHASLLRLLRCDHSTPRPSGRC
jgi:hypothetical protein